MSGSTIGGIAGGIIGFVVTGFNPAGAQWGFMIGSMIGAAVDPDKIAAPDGRDAQEQTTTDGIPIPVVWGSPPPFMGTVLDGEKKARRIKGKFRSGKGGPKVQDPDSYLWTGAILVCEGEIAGISFIVRNGVIVYDRRPNPQITAAETAKFASKIRLYTGSESQNPDPALEAMHGVGNTPYYRGRAYMVIVDDDVTDTAGGIAQYAFGVVKSGETQTVTVSEYAEPRLARFTDAHWPLADGPENYDYTGIIGIIGGGATTHSYTGTSLQDVLSYFSSYSYPGGTTRNPTQYIGYSATTEHDLVPNVGLSIAEHGVDASLPQPSVVDNTFVVLVYNELAPTMSFPYIGFSGGCSLAGHDDVIVDRVGSVAEYFPSDPGGQCAGFAEHCGSPPHLFYWHPLCIRVSRKRVLPSFAFGDPCDEQLPVRLPDAPDYSIDCDGVIDSAPEIEFQATGTFKRLRVATTTFDPVGEISSYASYPLGPVLPTGDPNYNSQAFWESAYNEAVLRGDWVAGKVYGVDYPATATGAYKYTFDQVYLDPGDVFLREVQEELAHRCDVPADRIDATELSAVTIPGYMVATAATGANASRGLQPMFFYDMPEVDGKIRCVRRGKPSVGTVTDDDFVAVETDDEDIRSQQVEFPKSIHLAYPDPALNYAITKQTFSREAATVVSVDEQIVSTTIPFDGDTAAKIADIMGKVAWASAEGRMKCVLPREFTLWNPSDCFDYGGKRWLITKAEYDSYATIKLEALYDRASNYTSIATGKDSRPPGSQTSGLRGPTRLETINLSPLLDSQDRLGLYFGVCGILEGWSGGTISASIDGGANYTTLGTWRDSSVMGHTTTDLPIGSPWVFDPDATVTVNVHGGELESATFLQLLNEANACVIGDEAVQFEHAVEVDDYTYTLTGLTRARHGTDVAAHPIHSRFVLMDDTLNFVELQASWIGRTITLHVQSLGTPAGTGYTETFVWTPANAQTEWPPFHLTATHDGSSTRIAWVGRARLGSTAAPFHSSFFDGYRVTLTDGTTTVTHNTTDQHFDYSDAQRTADFGSLDPLDVSIVALNRITGASPSLTGTI